MKYLKLLAKESAVRFLLFPFLLIILFLMTYYGKATSHLIINSWNSEIADRFFKHITHLGDGLVFVFVIIGLAFFKLRWSLYMLVAAVFNLITVFVLKKVIFTGIARPLKYFEGTESLHLVEGVKMHSMNSFPSGHTITAFSIFFILLMIVKKEYLKFLLVLTAILAGFSRVYISQHFLIDIFFGAILGILIAVLSCTLVDNLKVFKGKWTDMSLFQLFDKKNDD